MTLTLNCHRRVHLGSPEDLLTARQIAVRLATTAGLTPAGQERVSLVVTELATNLQRHAPDNGSMLLRQLDGGAGIECLCLDRGPGIEDVAAALRDGQTSAVADAVGLGFGLGAAQRLSDTFEIHSEPGVGTAVLARVREGDAGPLPSFASGAVMLAMAGQEECGDGWVVTSDGLVALIDGLGHGAPASLAARRAEEVARAGPHDDPRRMIDAMHLALRGTRGAVVMVVLLREGSVRFAGVGNIAGAVIGVDRVVGLHSTWGVVGGATIAGAKSFETAWAPGDVLLLHSDGLSKAIDLFTTRRLRYVEPTLAAAIVLRDAVTKLDDQTVVVVRHGSPPDSGRHGIGP
jgi:anti-sigma regulatory factor (Ser/Thr protein kinase)